MELFSSCGMHLPNYEWHFHLSPTCGYCMNVRTTDTARYICQIDIATVVRIQNTPAMGNGNFNIRLFPVLGRIFNHGEVTPFIRI